MEVGSSIRYSRGHLVWPFTEEFFFKIKIKERF